MKKLYFLFVVIIFGCQPKTIEEKPEIPFDWRGANLYFLLPDRFYNADESNDVNFKRTKSAATLRGFEGGDLKGIIKKLEENYFTDLGINAIWISPIFEQIHYGTDEGTGFSYPFHGYWTKDWTALDPNFGTKEDLKKLIKIAHDKKIRILLDAVVNHTGPVTEYDEVWPVDWVKTEPKCAYQNYETTIDCTLVENLPDVRTESNDSVSIPPFLVEKWKNEGRYEEQIYMLNDFFKHSDYPKAARIYIMKWLADWIKEFGFDGYRVDTVKHTEEYVWTEFREICDAAYAEFKKENPNEFLDEDFYLVGEVYNYGISGKQWFDFGDKKVDYFTDAFNSLINFEFKWNAKELSYETLFRKYDYILSNDLKDYGILNYLSSHDDGDPFDKNREKTFESATKLLLSPGTSQIYYGDEIARPLIVQGAQGDANLRSNMNWKDLEKEETKKLLVHYQKLGTFRRDHLAVGAGTHKMITESPYVFSRTYSKGNFTDLVIVGLDLPKGNKILKTPGFEDGTKLKDHYSNQEIEVVNGEVKIDSEFSIVLLYQP